MKSDPSFFTNDSAIWLQQEFAEPNKRILETDFEFNVPGPIDNKKLPIHSKTSSSTKSYYYILTRGVSAIHSDQVRPIDDELSSESRYKVSRKTPYYSDVIPFLWEL
jgi:hypothetical protein